MKIKRLEISGFKSFADKVILDFQQGVTGVVGPNGCGKSNIVDAIRWCMGEQSAKNLRGKAMEDVIFAGSESRKPLGLAEVTLVFSIEDGLAPARYLEFAEIQLTRRLFRDGESEYLINKTPCRLMDITELFMDTGVGTRAYSIIEQGKIAQVLHSRPEERRLLIEEAAGVTKFKARKQLAQKKIEDTRQNLERLSDLIGEIRRQLNSLQRQAKKAEKFKELRDELRETDLLFAVRESERLISRRVVADGELDALNGHADDLATALTSAEAEVEKYRIASVAAEQNLGTVQEKSFRVRGDAATAENSLAFRQKELQALQERKLRIEGELASLRVAFGEVLNSLKGLNDHQARAAAELAEAEERLRETQTTHDELESGFDQKGRILEASRRERFSAMATATDCRGKVEGAISRMAALDDRAKRQEVELEQLRARLAEISVRKEHFSAALLLKNNEMEVAEKELSRLAGEEQSLSARLPDAEKLWQARRDEFSAVSSRLNSLLELEAQFAGYGQGVQTLLKDSPVKLRMRGMLADTLEVPESLEAAVEAVLGDRLQLLLCDKQSDVVDSIGYLKEHGAGRVHMALPLQEEKGSEPAVIDGAFPLAGQVSAAPHASGLINRLLADVYLVESLPAALALASEHISLTFVTRGGEVVSLGQLVSGGSSEAVESGLIHKKREIKSLELQVSSLDNDVALFLGERDRLREQLQEVGKALLHSRNELHRHELEHAGLRKDLQQEEAESGRTEARLKALEPELEGLSGERQTLNSRMEDVLAMQAATEADVKRLEESEAAIIADIESQRGALAASRERLTALRVSVATTKEQGDSLLRTCGMEVARKGDIEGRIKQYEQDMAGCDEGMKSLILQTEEDEQRLKELLEMRLSIDEELKVAREGYEQIGALLSAAESKAKVDREHLDAVRKKQGELTIEFSSINLQMELMEKSIYERHRCSLVEAAERMQGRELDEVSAKARQADIERQLEELGEVNLMAIEEYAEMEARHTFLSSQKDDLEESINDLQQAIQKINRTTRKRFLETFNQVNEKFREVFPRLFCGGVAELRLTDEHDLLETGIDIIVQPPGKKLANVMLMSGGEKALTAVALIFSIFLIKPTPFCLLDEVDAPLDDANIGRFNEMVREMSAISQFIIITHNKTTMGVADTLYGITMEEPGASKTVSVRLQ